MIRLLVAWGVMSVVATACVAADHVGRQTRFLACQRREHAAEVDRIIRNNSMCPSCRGMAHELDLTRVIIAGQSDLLEHLNRKLVEAKTVVGWRGLGGS